MILFAGSASVVGVSCKGIDGVSVEGIDRVVGVSGTAAGAPLETSGVV